MDSIPLCTLCFKAYSLSANVPLMLRCGCTFCALCLKTMARPLQYNSVIKCPSCEVTTPYSSDVDMEGQLPANVYYLGLIITLELGLLVTPFPSSVFTYNRKKLPSVPSSSTSIAAGSTPLCEECSAREAKVHCLQCVGVYCSPCYSTVHGASLVMRKHKSVPITQTLSTPPTCHTHKGEQLKYWCTNDGVSVCTGCLIAGEHKGHDTITVGEKAEMFRSKLHPLFSVSMETMSNIKATLHNVDQQLRELSKVSSACSKQLAGVFLDFHTSLQVRETSLFENLSLATSNYVTPLLEARTVLLSALNKVQSTLLKVETTLKDDYVVIRCHGDLQTQLSEMTSLPQAIERSDVQSISVSLDKTASLEYISKLGRISFDYNSPILLTSTGEPWMTSDDGHAPHNSFLLPSPQAPPPSVTSNYLLSKPHPLLRSRSASPRVTLHPNRGQAPQDANLRVTSRRSLTPRMTSRRSQTPVTTGGRSPTSRLSGRQSPMNSGRSPTPRVSSVQSSKQNTPSRQPRPLTPVSLGDTVEVHVVHVESVGEVFVQRRDQSERITEVMKELNTPQTLTPVPRELVEEGATVAALFSEDNNFYRATIECVNMTTIAVVTVHYIDFGNSEDVTMDRLCVLPRHLSDIPPLCCRCSFKHIQPLPLKILEGVAPVGWTNKDKMKLEGLLFSQSSVRMKVLEHTPAGVLLVDLYLMSDGQLKSISEMLVDKKIAVWRRGKWEEPGIPPPIPLAQGDSIEVVVPVAENPWDFYVHPVSTSQELEVLTEQIQQSVEKCHLLPAPTPYMGMLCCTYYPDHDIWHRARVIKLVDDTTVEVHFIDYGNEEKVFASTLLSLNNKMMLPRQQAIHCQLPGVSPLDGPKWSEEVSDYFNTYVGGHVLKLLVVGEGNPLPVELNETSGQRSSISSHLVKEYKAQFLSPTKKKNNNNKKKTQQQFLSPTLLSNGGPQTPPSPSPSPPAVTDPLILPPLLPAVGLSLSIKPVYIVSPHLFHVQPAQQKDTIQLLTELAKIRAPLPPATLQPGHLYLSHFGDNLWHRVILESLLEGDLAHVTFIDFGNQATILAHGLREIPPALCTHPPLAVMCRLVGVAPVGGGEWSEQASMCFSNMIQAKSLTATVMAHVGEVIEVSLSLEGADVTQSLIQAGHATPTDHTHNGRYLPPVLPSKEEFTAAVTVVTEEGVVYGHIRDNVVQLKTLNRHIQEVCQSCDHQHPLELAVGQSCCARYQDETWCRVTVRGVKSGESVDVFFVDFGETESVPLTECVERVVDPHVPAQALPMRVVAMDEPSDELVDKDITVVYKGPAPTTSGDPVHLVELVERPSS